MPRSLWADMHGTAECLNENCERGEWNLTKRVEDYAGGGPSCPDCGTSRVAVEADEPRRGREQRAEPPARSETGQRAEAVPARQEGGNVSGIAAGVLALTDEDVDAQTRAKAAQQTLGGFGELASQVITYREQKRRARQEHAREADIEPVTDKPKCQECGYQFKEIPLSDDTIVCPDCGQEYNVMR